MNKEKALKAFEIMEKIDDLEDVIKKISKYELFADAPDFDATSYCIAALDLAKFLDFKEVIKKWLIDKAKTLDQELADL